MLNLIRWRARRLWGRIRFGRWLRVFGPYTIVNRRNVTLGNEVALNHGVYILGRTGVRIGDYVTLSANCMLLDAGLETRLALPETVRPHVDAPIVIEDRAWIGAGAIILAGVTVGQDSIVGAGSVVTHDVPPRVIVAGNPARIIRELR